jgi:hypothetical protein
MWQQLHAEHTALTGMHRLHRFLRYTCLNVGQLSCGLVPRRLVPFGARFRLTRSWRFFRLALTSVARVDEFPGASPLDSPLPARPDPGCLRLLESSLGWCTTKSRVRRENVRCTSPLRLVHRWLEGHAQRDLLNSRIICLARDRSEGTAVVLKRAVLSIRESPR